MFTVYHSNQIDLLKSLLAALIKQQPLSSPFEQEQILVQSPGMSQWLKMEIAEQEGIAANISFPLPATFIWNMFVEILPDVPSCSAFNKESMTWKLVQILPDLLKRESFISLSHYLDQDDDGSKCYQLAEKIADIFDGYLVYRPDYILAWESGEHPTELNQQDIWQGELWQELVAYTNSLGQSPYHRANLYQEFINALTSGCPINKSGLPKRLFVFGISSLPPKYLESLKALGEHIDVHLLFHNPCRYYWGDVKDQKTLARTAKRSRPRIRWQGKEWQQEQGETLLKGDVEHNQLPEFHHLSVSNNLLASLGKQGRDNLHLLSLLESNEVEAFVDSEPTSLLTHIQKDMLELKKHQDDSKLTSSYHKNALMASDDSLTLHSCHSATREVEALYDQLLHMFNADPELKPKDIIVMVSDINAYSPIIQAIFGNAPFDRRIPFSISDRTASQESPVLNAFMQLLNLPNSRFGRSEILTLLETPAILQRFAITESEFELLSVWIEEAGIRWGLDSQTSLDLELPKIDQNTWLFGLRRILMGYVMSVEHGFDLQGERVVPYQQVEGLQAELAGKFAHFVESLLNYRERLVTVRTASEWQQQLNQMLNAFFELDVENELAIKTIRDALSRLVEQTSEAGLIQTIDLKVVSDYLQNKLDNTRISQRFLAGQVNFCTLMPMRSIPFKVVCLLGMNDGAYPRNVVKEGFDLINVKPRYGDRSRRDDDRYLFLEAILSAQSKLYISYIGQSILDNTPKLPSIVVTELLEYCAQNYCLVEDEARPVDESGSKLIKAISHAYSMTPFSPNAFKGMGSFASEWVDEWNREGDFVAQKETTIQADIPPEIDFEEFIQFWALPVKFFFNRQLNIYFESLSESIEDNEPFSVSGLEMYQFKDQFLDVELTQKQEEVEQLSRWLKVSGELPVGHFGELELEEIKVISKQIADEAASLIVDKQPDIEVSVPFSISSGKRVHLIGWLKQRYASGYVYYRAGRIRSQDILSAWIRHLVAALCDASSPTHLLGYDNKLGVQHYSFAPVDKEKAHTLFNELTSIFVAGLSEPVPYFPRSALDAMQELNKRLTRFEPSEARQYAIEKFKTSFSGSYYGQGEGDNYYIQRIWSEVDEPLLHRAIELSEQILLPVLESLQIKD